MIIVWVDVPMVERSKNVPKGFVAQLARAIGCLLDLIYLDEKEK